MKYGVTILLVMGSLVGFGATFVAAAPGDWCSSDCVKKCRDTLPPGVTLEMCVTRWNCYGAYPKRPCRNDPPAKRKKAS